MIKNKKVVLALGGNALGNTPEKQYEAVKLTAKSIVDLIENKNKVIIVHGNGPQVGMISLAFEKGSSIDDKIPYLPLSLAGSMSQGYIGLHLQQAISNELNKRKLKRNVSTLITQTIVDKNDKSFKNPSKPIGIFYSEEEAKKIAKEKNVVVKEDSGRGWRIVVPSPKPISIFEKDVINQLFENDNNIVIAAGGGGVPTLVEKNGNISSVDAVIDKDFVASKLAEIIKADIFAIATAEDGIWKNYGKPDGYKLKDAKVDELESLLNNNEFAEGSMKPKVESIVSFMNNTKNTKSCIVSLEKLKKSLSEDSNSWITKK